MSATTDKRIANDARGAHSLQGLVSVPVEVWWGLEWVKTEAWQEDARTITARLKTRTGEIRMCRIRNSKSVKMWRHANAAHERPATSDNR